MLNVDDKALRNRDNEGVLGERQGVGQGVEEILLY